MTVPQSKYSGVIDWNCRLFFNYYYLMSRHSSWPLPLNLSMYLHNSPVTETELHISYISIFTTLPLFYPQKRLNAKNVLVIFFLLPGRYDNVFVKKEKNMFPLTLLAPILNLYCHIWTSTVKNQILVMYNISKNIYKKVLPTYFPFFFSRMLVKTEIYFFSLTHFISSM
jgi:hypothetical protein